MELVHIEIPCRHFFRVWCDTSLVRYHIKLIPPRWYNEIHQANSTLSATIEQEPFIIRDHVENKDIPNHRFRLCSDFQSILNDVITDGSKITKPTSAQFNEKKRFGDFTSKFKIAELAAPNPDTTALIGQGCYSYHCSRHRWYTRTTGSKRKPFSVEGERYGSSKRRQGSRLVAIVGKWAVTSEPIPECGDH